MKLALLCSIIIPLLCGCATVISTQTPRVPDDAPSFTNLETSKIVLLILENQNDIPENILRLPFINYVKEHGTYFSNYYAVAHPSQPNYVAMVSGSYTGINGDEPSVVDRQHIGKAPGSWAVYAEGYPRGKCVTDAFYGGNARKHIPYLSFKDVQTGEACATNIRPFEDFGADARSGRLPALSLLIPNLAHDGHDRPLSEGALWLDHVLSPLLLDAVFREEVTLVVTFDEAEWLGGGSTRGNNVITLMWGRSVAPNCIVPYVYNHYDLAKTISALIKETPVASDDMRSRIMTGMWNQCSK